MTDRVYPSTKPAANGAAAAAPASTNGAANPTFPANKAQLYNAARPAYRPQPPPRRRHRRGCCCSCCLWTTLIVLLVLLLAAIAGAVFYVLYRPHRPSFSVAALHLSRFNLTDTTYTSAFNLTLTARNRNSKITFLYDQISVKVLSGDVDIGDGSFLASPTIQLDTKVKAKIGNIKTKKLTIRVICDGIRISIPTGKTASVATTSKVKCKVDPRVKIIKWTV
ncbi:hypothetical protein DH2020_038221 [Rehmannia glutinosa]|uniref:Late embryogenesis abundant protein LEA-2 subgroup domain-containing protein n=1 Tax=Rehmannia glutinosa TaxID=99300 RepID=A0ABR0UZ52_REHGL